MGKPTLLGNVMRNVALHRTGQRDEAVLYPLAACWLVTYRCELRCAYCLENTRNRCPDGDIRELETADALKVVRGLREVCDVIDFSGGEPCLRGDLPELLEEARRLQFEEVMLNSNGLHVLERPQILDSIHTLMLGVDAMTEDWFVELTGGTREQFRGQMKALDELLRLQKERRFDLQICCVMMSGRLHEAEKVIDWCLAHDVMVSPSPHQDREFRVEPSLRRDPAYRALVDKLVRYRKKGLPLLGSVSYYEAMRDLGEHRCVPMANLTVNPMGQMFWPCGEIQKAGPSFVEGKPYRQMVEEARAKLGPLPDCRDRCHFSCRMAFSSVINHPWELPGEGLHLRKWRRYAG